MITAMEMVEQGQNQHSSAPKRIKMMEEEDRMCALPDCLLVEIVSRLPSTKEEIRTGILSKRWQHLWPYVTTLIFINHGVDYPLDKKFFSFVDKTLTQCRHLNLHKFQLHSTYYVEFELQVNNFIRYAIDCHVRELDLELTGLNFEAEFLLDEYIFINPCFTDLKLGGCIINPSVEISWNALRSLCIVGGKLDEDMIQRILSGSPLLETLNLQYCYGYRRIDITSKTVKNLLFSGYYDADETAIVIEINAPYIWSLTIQYELFVWNFLLRNVSSLVEANLDYTKEGQHDWYDETTPEHEEEEMLKRFISNLHHVKKLTIGSDCSTVFSRLKAKGFISPSNIKVVDVTSHLYSNGEALELNDLSDRESRVEINCLTVVLEMMRLIGCWH